MILPFIVLSKLTGIFIVYCFVTADDDFHCLLFVSADDDFHFLVRQTINFTINYNNAYLSIPG